MNNQQPIIQYSLSVDKPGFLEDMAQLIAGWTNDKRKLQYLQEQITAFHEDYQSRDKKYYPLGKEYRRQVEETKKLDGEENEDHQYRIDRILLPSWENLLKLPDCHTLLEVLGSGCIDSKEPKQTLPRKKQSQVYCVHLAILHDKTFENVVLVNSISADIWPQDEPWVVGQWDQMRQERQGWQSIKLNQFFGRAFDAVEAHFAQTLPNRIKRGKGKLNDQVNTYYAQNPDIINPKAPAIASWINNECDPGKYLPAKADSIRDTKAWEKQHTRSG